MLVLRKLMLLTSSLIAVMALSASPAFADPVEMLNEDGEEPVHCEAVELDGDDVLGGCDLHGVGEVDLTAHIFGTEVLIASCENEFDIKVDEDGHGYIYDFETTGTSPCDTYGQANGDPWEFELEGNGDGTYVMNADVAITDGSTSCSGALAVDVTDGETSVTASAVDERIGATMCEVDGEWEFEGPEEDSNFAFFAPVGTITRNTPTLNFLNTIGTMHTITFKNETNWWVMIEEVHITGSVPGRFTNNQCVIGGTGVVLIPNQTCTIELTRAAGNGALPAEIRVYWERYRGGLINPEVGDSRPSDPVQLTN